MVLSWGSTCNEINIYYEKYAHQGKLCMCVLGKHARKCTDTLAELFFAEFIS